MNQLRAMTIWATTSGVGSRSAAKTTSTKQLRAMTHSHWSRISVAAAAPSGAAVSRSAVTDMALPLHGECDLGADPGADPDKAVYESDEWVDKEHGGILSLKIVAWAAHGLKVLKVCLGNF